MGLVLLLAVIAAEAAWLRGYDIWAPARRADALVEALWDRVLPWRAAPSVPAADGGYDAEAGGGGLAELTRELIDASLSRAAAERQRLAERRAALTELQELATFMLLCGEVNPGFEGCRSERTPGSGDAYAFSTVTGADGFIISAAARGAQTEDRCALLVVDSNLEIEAFTAAGEQVTSECVAPDFLQAQAVIPARSEDLASPLPAPSGAKLLQRDLAQAAGTQGEAGLAQN